MVGKKVLVLSYHNWITKRWGGLHSIGEALVEDGCSVLFWSLTRTYWGAFSSRDERLRWENLKGILNPQRGKTREPGLTNLALLSWEMIGERRIPGMVWFNDWARGRVWKRFLRYLQEEEFAPDLIVLESCEGLYYFERLKELFPKAKVVYRVSDPILGWAYPWPLMVVAEKRVHEKADLVLFTSQLRKEKYQKLYGPWDGRVQVLANGMDLEGFQTPHSPPNLFPEKRRIYCYVGATEPFWEAVLALARQDPSALVVVVCPVSPSVRVKGAIRRVKNIVFQDGISPKEVPSYLQNCSVVIVPYPEWLIKAERGLHSKILQAMVSGKPIVALNTGEGLEEFGVCVTSRVEDFVSQALQAGGEGVKEYPLDFTLYSWTRFKEEFLRRVHALGRER